MSSFIAVYPGQCSCGCEEYFSIGTDIEYNLDNEIIKTSHKTRKFAVCKKCFMSKSASLIINELCVDCRN